MFEDSGTENGSSTENSGTPETPATEPTSKPEKAAKQPKAKGKKTAPKKAAKSSKSGKAAKKSAPKNTPKAAKPTKSVKSAAPVSPTSNQMPPVGTVIEKKDRQGNVRAKCKVTEEGVQFEGKLYGSLSAAAMAAAESLGLKSTAQNGWVFWGLKALPSATDPVESLQKASEKFIERAKAVVITEENKAEVARIMKAHRTALEKLDW